VVPAFSAWWTLIGGGNRLRRLFLRGQRPRQLFDQPTAVELALDDHHRDRGSGPGSFVIPVQD
jgi:hypothetical protein